MNEKSKKAVAALRKLGQRLRHGWDGFHSSDKVGSLHSIKKDLKKKWQREERARRTAELSEKHSSLSPSLSQASGGIIRGGHGQKQAAKRPVGNRRPGSNAKAKSSSKGRRIASGSAAKPEGTGPKKSS